MTHLCQSWGKSVAKRSQRKKNLFLTSKKKKKTKKRNTHTHTQFITFNHKIPLGQLEKYRHICVSILLGVVSNRL